MILLTKIQPRMWDSLYWKGSLSVLIQMGAWALKCPGFFCVPWKLLCNGRWDCPGGVDENQCHNRVCAGLFKCRNSSLCIWHEEQCDGQTQCPLGDDEQFCDLKYHQCPGNCSCLLYSLFCNTPHAEFNGVKSYLALKHFSTIHLKWEHWFIFLGALWQGVFLNMSVKQKMIDLQIYEAGHVDAQSMKGWHKIEN